MTPPWSFQPPPPPPRLLPQAMLKVPAIILDLKGTSNQQMLSGGEGDARICGCLLNCQGVCPGRLGNAS